MLSMVRFGFQATMGSHVLKILSLSVGFVSKRDVEVLKLKYLMTWI